MEKMTNQYGYEQYNGFVDGKQVECVISCDEEKDMYECIVAKNGKIDNKYYSIKKTAMETIAKILTESKE